jgi:hypothetical protein
MAPRLRNLTCIHGSRMERLMLGFCLHSVKYRTLGYWRIFRRSGDKLADLSHRRNLRQLNRVLSAIALASRDSDLAARLPLFLVRLMHNL